MDTNHNTKPQPEAIPHEALKAWADRTIRRALDGARLLRQANPPAKRC